MDLGTFRCRCRRHAIPGPCKPGSFIKVLHPAGGPDRRLGVSALSSPPSKFQFESPKTQY